VTGTFSIGGEGTGVGESGLLVDVIALINTIPMRTSSRGATHDAYVKRVNTRSTIKAL